MSPISRIGNKTSGRRDVAAMGIASVIHQTAINKPTPATCHALLDNPEGAGKNRVTKNNAGPETSPTMRIRSAFKLEYYVFVDGKW